jgi:phenylacetate-CoA ligase
VLERRASLDSLEVEVEVAEDAPGDEARREALRAFIANRLDAALGISTVVTLQPPGTLPRSEGKAQRVVDRRTL